MRREKEASTSSSETASEEGGSDESGSDETEKGGDYVYRVGFVNIDNADNCCYPAMQKFVEYVESDEFAKSVGADKVEAITADSAKDIEKQTTNVETLLSKGVDMMFIIGVDTQGNTTAVNACNEEGIPVFMVGTEASAVSGNSSDLMKKRLAKDRANGVQKIFRKMQISATCRERQDVKRHFSVKKAL